jgi:choline dehydrogenase
MLCGASGRSWVRKPGSDSIYHPAGTCRMGPATEADAVVDALLRVHSVEGLRVADASNMPQVVDVPTHAACVMIGEACADMVTAGRNNWPTIRA